ncbi:MAG: DNA polymerase III subunit delta [Bacteroidales bacterium]|nr:DNA polymerase III subunit delta [Bacteroidales bacterium]
MLADEVDARFCFTFEHGINNPMQFKSIIGQEEVKTRLLTGIRENRVAHTQLFLGPEGSGSLALAIAFGQYINCTNRTETDSCGTCPSCVKFQKLIHPDLYFYFPTTTTDAVKKDPRSSILLSEWRRYLLKNDTYVTQSGWYEYLKVGNKQGYIRKDDANELIGKIALKPFEGEYKVVIFWMTERMNEAASNKLLKTFEEPPDKTLIFLVAERYELLLATVRSRAQIVKIPPLKDREIAAELMRQKGIGENKADQMATLATGNWNQAVNLLEHAEDSQANFIRFRQWLRLCFRPKNYVELNKFNGELGRMGREKQKRFLQYGLEVVHSSILLNQGNEKMLKKNGEELDFSIKFAPLVNTANQLEIYHLFNEAIYHIERNAHGGILFSDLSFKLHDLLTEGKRQMVK